MVLRSIGIVWLLAVLLGLTVVEFTVAKVTVPEASSESESDSLLIAENLKYVNLHADVRELVQDAITATEKVLGDGYTPSATPLILLSPEVSVWSMVDELGGVDSTRHWSGQEMSLNGAIQVDGAVYAFLGNTSEFQTTGLVQESKMVLATTTFYSFLTPEGVQLQILFTSVVDQPNTETELLRPYSYVTISVNNTNTNSHHIQVYVDVFADWVLDQKFNADQNIGWPPLTGLDPSNWITNIIYNYDDIPFSEKGDYIKMNWGMMIMASPADGRVSHSVGEAAANRQAFASNQALPIDDPAQVRSFTDRPVSSAFVYNFGVLGFNETTGGYLLIGYDDIVSMNYFGNWMNPLWMALWKSDLHAMILDGISNWRTLVTRCLNFDNILFSQLQSAGGVEYSVITSLAYRQVTGGIKGVWNSKTNESWWFMKEISSDGDVSTVDVIYPASPFFIQFAPEILRKMLLPLLEYAMNHTNINYNLPWAPHHLGFWPVCDITPDEQEQMPMEETANFFLMVAGIVQEQESTLWLGTYWNLFANWGQYLISSLPDPGNQLCTDDFEGPSPHNVNLALKGILGLSAYALILEFDGQTAAAQAINTQANNFAAQWLIDSFDSTGGNHTRLQYDLPGSWSMKYNMLYQYILGLDVFPPSVMAQEVEFYQTQMNPWGLPLDSRGPLSKTDWTSWIAAMSTNTTFSTSLYQHLLLFVIESPSRGVPFSDWYDTSNGQVLGFRARPVQGGLFAKLLLESKPMRQPPKQVEEEVMVDDE